MRKQMRMQSWCQTINSKSSACREDSWLPSGREVTNLMTNISNSIKRNVKALSPAGGGDPEWVNKGKEKDRRRQELRNGLSPPSCKNKENENDGRQSTRESTRLKPKKTPPIASPCKENKRKRTPVKAKHAPPRTSVKPKRLLQFQAPAMVSNLNALN
jgi:hypothetical protein